MKGYPKNLQTREDYEYVLANFSKDDWKQDFQNLLSTRWMSIYQHRMSDDEIVPDDIKHKVLYQTDEKTGIIYRELYYIIENPDAKIFKLGYTVEEVENILNN